MGVRIAGSSADRKFLIGLARAAGAAVFFSLPLLMTMEMWWLGFYMDRGRLLLLLLLHFPLLVGLSHYSGFEETFSFTREFLDAAVAFAVGLVISAFVLWLFDVLEPTDPLGEVVGKVVLQAVPASFGAVLANSQFAADDERDREQQPQGYGAELLLMLAGAMFLAFNVAPTEEMMLIAYRLGFLRGLALLGVTLLMMHGFVYAAAFRGTPDIPPETSRVRLFLQFTVVGYVIALAVSAYILWTFGRLEDRAFGEYVLASVVLAFPAGLGAAAARLVI